MTRSYLDVIQVAKQDEMNKLGAFRIDQINRSYYPYGQLLESFSRDRVMSDSVLIIHKLTSKGKLNFEKPYFIERSLLLDLSRNDFYYLTYIEDSVKMCPIYSFNSNNKFIKKLIELNRSISIPDEYLFSSRNYLIELRVKSGDALYYICIEGLPNNYFFKDKLLKQDTEWFWLENIMNAR